MAEESHTGLGNQRNIIKNSTLKSLTKEPASTWDDSKLPDLNTKDSLKVIASTDIDVSTKFGDFKVPSVKDKLSSLAGDIGSKLKSALPLDLKAMKDAANLDGRISSFTSGMGDIKGLIGNTKAGGFLNSLISLDGDTLAKVGRFIATNPSILTKQGLTAFIKDQGKGFANDLIKKLGLPKNLIDCLTNNMLNETSFGSSFGGHSITMKSLIDKFLAKNKCAKAAMMDLDPGYFGSSNGRGPGGFLSQIANNALLNTMINGDPKNAEYWFRAAMAVNDNKPYLLKGTSQSLHSREYAYVKLHMVSNYYVKPNSQTTISPIERAALYTPSAIVIKNIELTAEDKKDPTSAMDTIVGGLGVLDKNWNKDDNGNECYSKFKGNSGIEELADLALTTEGTKTVNLEATPALQSNQYLARIDSDDRQGYINAVKGFNSKESKAFMEIVNLGLEPLQGFLYKGPLGYHFILPEEAANEISQDVVKNAKKITTNTHTTRVEHSVDMSSLADIAKEDPELMRILTGKVILEYINSSYVLCESQSKCIERVVNSPTVTLNSRQRDRFEFLRGLNLIDDTNLEETVYFDAIIEELVSDKLSYLVSLTPEQKLIALNMIVAMSPAERLELNSAYDEINLSGIYKTVIGHKHAMKLASLSTGEVPKSLTA